MPTVVVLGFHRSGTSLVANMLTRMGVDMGTQLLGSHPTNPQGHFEDLDFVRMNAEILAGSGGTWDDPPSSVDWQAFRPELVMLVTLKKQPELHEGEARQPGDWWGWKDPRTCLTAACYHGYLDQPHYVVIDRARESIIASLEWREGKAGDHWDKLVDHYLDQRAWFLQHCNAPMIRLDYADLVSSNRTLALQSALGLAKFLGFGVDEAKAALKVVKPRADDRPRKLHSVDLDEANASERTRGWARVAGPVDGLIIREGVDNDEARGWLAKVQPLGWVEDQTEIGVNHDWPKTAWTTNGGAIFRRHPFLKAGDPFGTIGIGVPYFKANYDFWRWWSWVLLKGLRPGDEFLNNESVMAPLPIPVVHNRLIARFLETDRDTLCIVEDDHCGDPPDTMDWGIIERMRDKRENWDFDIVTANYVNRRADPGIVGYGLAEKPNRFGEYTCILEYDDVWETGTQPVDGSVMGLVLIRRWVLVEMLGGRNPKHGYWCQWQGANSQDVNFYGKARDVGAKVGVDRDANIGHASYEVRSVSDFWKRRGR